ncbi:RING finger protein 122 isoform X1 [Etheostoma spectabile]|uniref:RING finger protein 122 isoform X1 n=1 Tax=Etheostoma spectabile TaxID=54343 RepID=UPI0013AE8A2E|nr:RING finger protein 122-like isoform X1 [Etheostoma spectabile]
MEIRHCIHLACPSRGPNCRVGTTDLSYSCYESLLPYRCCSLSASLRLKQQGTREQFSYNEVVLKGASKKLSLLGQTCAVCLEEFRTRDELGVCSCSHAFHKKCLLKWLEIRSVCPMCNKPILRLHTDAPQGAEGPMDPEEV